MRVANQVRVNDRKGWSRAMAMLLIAAAGLSFAPRPAAAAQDPCHTPVSQNVLTTAHDDCGQCAQASCVAMPGCAHGLAVVQAPAAGPLLAPDHALLQPDTPAVPDGASLGPPTPPPNS